jgi:hypothetical protein
VRDWTPEPFSPAFGAQCAEELARKIFRCPMNEQARKREIREFAEVVKEVMRKQKGK